MKGRECVNCAMGVGFCKDDVVDGRVAKSLEWIPRTKLGSFRGFRCGPEDISWCR